MIGENGAFTFFLKGASSSRKVSRQRLDTPKGHSDFELHERLGRLRSEIQAQFPKAQVASDQAYREWDLAIDICEDVEPWHPEAVQRLLDFCRGAGAHAKLSSIHVNIWFGDYDKKKGFEFWLSSAEAQGAPAADRWLYVGDSPNDEPLFASFQRSVGVANVKKYLDQLQARPTWITSQACGGGFVEMTDRLIQSRQS